VTATSRLSRRATIFAACVALIPLPASAAGGSPPAKRVAVETARAPEPRPLRAAIEQLDSRDLQTPSKPVEKAPRRSAQGADTVKQSPAFFKTGPGIAVLAVIAAGVGYALYSTSNDRIHSPGKE
jgi:hypothetical protein